MAHDVWWASSSYPAAPCVAIATATPPLGDTALTRWLASSTVPTLLPRAHPHTTFRVCSRTLHHEVPPSWCVEAADKRGQRSHHTNSPHTQPARAAPHRKGRRRHCSQLLTGTRRYFSAHSTSSQGCCQPATVGARTKRGQPAAARNWGGLVVKGWLVPADIVGKHVEGDLGNAVEREVEHGGGGRRRLSGDCAVAVRACTSGDDAAAGVVRVSRGGCCGLDDGASSRGLVRPLSVVTTATARWFLPGPAELGC